MLHSYIHYLKKSFTDSFKKEEYKKYWNVPSSERLVKVGLPAGFVSGIGYIVSSIVIAATDNRLLGYGVFAAVLIFVAMPVAQFQAEKLKSKYLK